MKWDDHQRERVCDFIAETKPGGLSEKLWGVWLGKLQQFPPDQALQALEDCIASESHYPRLNQVLERCRELDPERKAGEVSVACAICGGDNTFQVGLYLADYVTCTRAEIPTEPDKGPECRVASVSFRDGVVRYALTPQDARELKIRPFQLVLACHHCFGERENLYSEPLGPWVDRWRERQTQLGRFMWWKIPAERERFLRIYRGEKREERRVSLRQHARESPEAVPDWLRGRLQGPDASIAHHVTADAEATVGRRGFLLGGLLAAASLLVPIPKKTIVAVEGIELPSRMPEVPYTPCIATGASFCDYGTFNTNDFKLLWVNEPEENETD